MDSVFLQLVALGKEERNLEYKQSTSWNDNKFRLRLVKSILAMSNIRDGGHIVIGMEGQPDSRYLPRGMTQEHLDSYTPDDVMRVAAEYADPYVRFTLTKERDQAGRNYVWIQVQEFDEIPVICRKSYSDVLDGGKLYTRTRRIPESAEVPSSSEMREIIEMASERALRAFLQRADRAGFQLAIAPALRDEDSFKDQLRGII